MKFSYIYFINIILYSILLSFDTSPSSNKLIEFSRYSIVKSLEGSKTTLIFKDTIILMEDGILQLNEILDSVFITTELPKGSQYREMFLSYCDYYGKENLISIDSNETQINYVWFNGVDTLIRKGSFRFINDSAGIYVVDLADNNIKDLYKKGVKSYYGKTFNSNWQNRYEYMKDTTVDFENSSKRMVYMVVSNYGYKGDLRGKGSAGQILDKIYYDKELVIPLVSEFYLYELWDKKTKMDTIIQRDIFRPLN